MSVGAVPMLIHCALFSAAYDKEMILPARGLLFWLVKVPVMVRVEPTW